MEFEKRIFVEVTIMDLLLNKITYPSDLKQLTEEQLISLANELRQYIIDAVSINPGHLGASLGVIELTIALHYAYNTPSDKIIWDVGHQAYAHKILTGRKQLFHTNRKHKGISGFPKLNESEYDAFGTGHSSTSISAALGMASAYKMQGEKNKKVVAVIGDGSLTGGLAFEGLNNAGHQNADILVVLNDNNMAIDPSVGALSEYLIDITTSQTYNRVKNDVWQILGKINKMGPNAQKIAQNLENTLKSFLLKQSNLFESLNFRYFGPVDGHDVVHLSKLFKDLKDIEGPKLLHCITKKGKGYKQAEINQTFWHAPGKFNKDTGEVINLSQNPEPPNYQEVFGHTITELALENDKIVGITPAMPTGSSLNIMMKKMPGRVFDVGIAEQHAVTFSAGLASQGMIPFCNIYSTFMQRAYDQIIHDVALQKLHVVFFLDRAGIVGEDGATHHGAYDLAYLRCIPDLAIAAPMNEEELRNMMYTAQAEKTGPFAIRYPRGKGTMLTWRKPFKKLPIGKGRCIKEGSEIAIISIGHVGNFALEAINKINAPHISPALYDMRFLKPLDHELLHEVFNKYKKIITIEDGTITGGLGSAVLEFMSDNDYKAKVVRLGIPDRFIEHGTQQALYKECGYDTNHIVSVVKSLAGSHVMTKVI